MGDERRPTPNKSRKAKTSKSNQAKEQKMKSLEFFKSKTASSRPTSRVTWPNDNKAIGNCFHALIAGLRPAGLILARRIAFRLVLLGAGLALIQPCAGQSGTWEETGSLATARYSHTETLLPNSEVP